MFSFKYASAMYSLGSRYVIIIIVDFAELNYKILNKQKQIFTLQLY